MRSDLAAIGTVILALLISCSGANAQAVPPGDGKVPVVPVPQGTIPNDMPTANPNAAPIIVPPAALTVPPVDRDRMACEASLQAYHEQGCYENCTDDCKSIESDLRMCTNIGPLGAHARNEVMAFFAGESGRARV